MVYEITFQAHTTGEILMIYSTRSSPQFRKHFRCHLPWKLAILLIHLEKGDDRIFTKPLDKRQRCFQTCTVSVLLLTFRLAEVSCWECIERPLPSNSTLLPFRKVLLRM